MTHPIADKLISWYQVNKRDLPWRHTQDPYLIWLSEIILQQTRVDQGMSYYQKFATHYPTVQDLASAPEDEVLRHWQGLGYYSRARNLHFTAKMVVNELDGRFPTNYDQLIQLKGVGEYTAGAIASFSSGEAVPVVDGNVFRVLSRLFNIETDIASVPAKKEFKQVAAELLPAKQAADFNQAIMEFGALQCVPKNPNCDSCPLQESCLAYEKGKVHELPIKLKKVKVRHRYFHYVIVELEGKIAMFKRGKNDIWEGLYEPLLLEGTKEFEFPESSEDASLNPLLEQGKLQINHWTSKHQLSHQKLHGHFHRLILNSDQSVLLPKHWTFYNKTAVMDLPKPVLVNNYLKEHYF